MRVERDMISIREEVPNDVPAIRVVNERAFGRPEEANLVDALRERCDHLLSLVATPREHIVGHILFSPVIVEEHENVTGGMGLAPMAVLPEFQRRGIGTKLIAELVSRAQQRHVPVQLRVLKCNPARVLYERLGFQLAGETETHIVMSTDAV